MIRLLNSKDYTNFIEFCLNQGSRKDFFITKNHQRFLINNPKIASEVFHNCIKRGDKCFVSELNGMINGVFLILGFSNKSEKKIIKVCGYNTQILKNLFKFLTWQYNKQAFIEVYKNTFLHKFLEYKKENKISYRYFFKFNQIKDNTILLSYEPDMKLTNFSIIKKEED